MTVKEIKKMLGVSPTASLVTVTITPKIATKLLECNTRNRKVSQRAVQRYASMMKDGKWDLSNDLITFNSDGVLTNGQHRLIALTMSGKTVKFNVGFNVENTLEMDRGHARTVSDNIELFGGCNLELAHDRTVHRVATVLSTFRNGSYRCTKISTSDVLELLNKYEKEFIDCREAGLFSCTDGKLGNRTVVCAFLMAYIDGYKMDDLVHVREVLTTGVPRDDYDLPILALRDKLIGKISGSGRDADVARMQSTQYCLYAYSKKRTSRIVKTGTYYYTV